MRPRQPKRKSKRPSVLRVRACGLNSTACVTARRRTVSWPLPVLRRSSGAPTTNQKWACFTTSFKHSAKLTCALASMNTRPRGSIPELSLSPKESIMNGDFSRTTFRPEMHYSGVLMQQGRVLLDSDWNEQVALFNYYFQTLARDLIGPYGGPRLNAGFKVLKQGDKEIPEELKGTALTHNFWIGPGHYYVDGLLCQNDGLKLYAPPDAGAGISQSDWIPEEWDGDGPYLVYLDVWQRHVTALEDQAIREVALGPQGPDTTTRVKTVWQVKTIKLTDQAFNNLTCANTITLPGSTTIHEGWAKLLKD